MQEQNSGGRDRPGEVGKEPRPTPVEVPPLDVNGVRTVQVGAALWALALLALLPFYSLLQESGRLWWIWTCTAGLSMGLFGIEYCRRRAATARTPAASETSRGGRRRA